MSLMRERFEFQKAVETSPDANRPFLEKMVAWVSARTSWRDSQRSEIVDPCWCSPIQLFRRTSAGELCRSNQLFTAHLLGGDKFSYQRNSCTSTRFRFNKKLNYKLAALEVFLPNRNAFASVVAALKIYCTSRRVILRTSYWGIFHCIFSLLVFIKH